MAIYRKTVIGIVLLGTAVTALLVIRSTFSRIEVKTVEAAHKELIITVTATSTGTVKADEEVRLTAQRLGTISKLFIEEGSLVGKGVTVAELDPAEALERRNASAAALRRAQESLEALRLGYLSFRAEADSDIAKTSSVLKEAETRLARMNEIKEKGYLSQAEFDIIKKEHDVALAGYSAALAARERVKSREVEIRAQEAAVRQAKSEYGLADINYGYSFIKSQIAGVVTSRPVKLGETVAVGALIASVVSPDSFYIESFIDEADVAKVAVGQDVKVTMDAYPGRVLEGAVSMISPVVLGGKQEARTFEVRVRLKGDEVTIKPGMSADVEVVVGKAENALLVPSQSVIEKDEGRFVYVVKGARAELRKVETGRYNWNFTEVTSGLRQGEIVVANADLPGLGNGVRLKLAGRLQ